MGTSESVRKSFLILFRLLKDQNYLVVEESIAKNFKTKLSYGFNHSSDLQNKNLRIEQKAYLFDFVYKGKTFEDFTFRLPGRHNLLNAARSNFSMFA